LLRKLDVRAHAKRANVHSSTFGFADTRANAEKPKELEFCHRSTENEQEI